MKSDQEDNTPLQGVSMPQNGLGRYVREESLGYHTSRVTRIILKRLEAIFAAHGVPIRTEEFPFLSYLWGNDGQSQKDLAEAMFREKSGIAKIASRLESIGLITRETGLTDAREKRLFFTEEGLRVMEEAAELAQGVLEEGQRGVSKEDLDVCKDVLKRVFENFQNGG